MKTPNGLSRRNLLLGSVAAIGLGEAGGRNEIWALAAEPGQGAAPLCEVVLRNMDESLNGKFRAEYLNTHWFMSLDEARGKCEAWRRDYNEVRPYSAIGIKVPAALHRAPRNPASRARDEAAVSSGKVVQHGAKVTGATV